MPEQRGNFGRMGRMGSGSRPTGRTGSGPVEHIGEGHANRLNAGLYSTTAVDFVIDYSRSMRDILPTVYIFCRDLMNACRLGKDDVRFGLTFFSDKAEKKTWKGEDFTRVLTDVMDGMLAQSAGGGSYEGSEDIEQAVRASMQKLAQVPAGERVMILFTDTPSKDKRLMDFKGDVPLRSVLLFVPTTYSGSEYLFDMVDADGNPERSRTPFVFDIREVMQSRYLKKENTPLEDNEETRNQLLLALS